MRAREWRDFPSVPKRAVYADISMAYFKGTLVGGAIQVVKQGIVDPPFYTQVPTSEMWINGTKSIYSWQIKGIAVGHPGFSLRIETSDNGSNLDVYDTHLIIPGGLASCVTGLYIPGMGVRFTLVNGANSGGVSVECYIKQQGVQ
jgi:hypothetical protein